MTRGLLTSAVALLTPLTLLLPVPGASAAEAAPALRDIEYLSSADETKQRAMFFAPEAEQAVPLIVALHTWSGDYRQNHHQAIAEWCIANGWAYIHPNFRGPNRRPEATGSKLVVKDIVSAVEYAQRNAKIDASAIFLVGTSGGGYTCLVMAGHRPELWAGVSAWVPVSDLKAWYEQDQYRDDLVKSCGGAPGDSAEVDEQYRLRSPLTYLANAKGVTLHINAGIYDGHQGSVPISHSLLAFNEVAEDGDRVSAADIDHFVEKAEVPDHLKADIEDSSYGQKRPLFRRSSGSATVTIFDGGHELVAEAATAWIAGIQRQRQSQSERSQDR